MAKFYCLVEMNGATYEVSVDAAEDYQAKLMLEAQYGKDKVIGWPREKTGGGSWF